MRSSALVLLTPLACTPSPARAPDTPRAPVRLAILAPAPGDTLIEGHRYIIRWTAPQGMRIALGAAMGGKDKGMLLENAPAMPDSLVWVVPAGFVTGFGITSDSLVRLRLSNAANPGQWVEAGPLTVVGTALPSQ